LAAVRPASSCGQLLHRGQRVADAAVAERERLDAGLLQLLLERLLRSVRHDEIGLQRQDAFEVRIEQRADLRQLLDLCGALVETADAHHLRSGTHRKEHFGGSRHERDHPRSDGRRVRRLRGRLPTGAGHGTQDDRENDTNEAT
jgi:hypothetical protein